MLADKIVSFVSLAPEMSCCWCVEGMQIGDDNNDDGGCEIGGNFGTAIVDVAAETPVECIEANELTECVDPNWDDCRDEDCEKALGLGGQLFFSHCSFNVSLRCMSCRTHCSLRRSSMSLVKRMKRLILYRLSFSASMSALNLRSTVLSRNFISVLLTDKCC